jgi:hypothetical protein
MAYPFTVTVNFDILCDFHIEAATKPGEFEARGLNPSRGVEQISLQSVKSRKELKELKIELDRVLKEYQLNEHLKHFIYLFYLFYEVDAPFYKEKEVQIAHAAGRIDKLIELQRIKEQCTSTDLTLTIKQKGKRASIRFEDTLKNATWNDLYKSLQNSYIVDGTNFLLIQRLNNQEISLQLLKDFRKELKLRSNSFWNKALASFSNMLLLYLNKLNIFKSDTEISYKQGHLIYDLIEVFQLQNHKSIGSRKDKYIIALLTNNGYL